jgi:hypothetical protein
MKRKDASIQSDRLLEAEPSRERREFGRIGLPATAFASDMDGNELGRVVEISGGGLLINPSSPWARLALVKGQQLIAVVVEPANGNRTEMKVEVRHIHSRSIGLRFL